MWVFVVVVVLSVVSALGLLLVVAISAGRLNNPRVARWERVADTANRHLEGRGNPPRILQKLDIRED